MLTSMPTPAPDPATLLALATRLAHEAAAVIADGWGSAAASAETKSTVTDMVTEVDRASEELIVRGILASRPDDGILGEEGSSREGTSGVRWVIDPLDGTTNFVYSIPAVAVSIGVEVNGEAVAAVVHDVAHNETFTALRGKGARLNGAPISVGSVPTLATALVGTGFGYTPERRRNQGLHVARVLPHIRDIRRGGSAALDLCSVACGRLDAYFEQGIQPWDWAAGVLIIEEAGGVFGWLAGESLMLDPAPLVAGNPALYEPLRELLETTAEPAS